MATLDSTQFNQLVQEVREALLTGSQGVGELEVADSLDNIVSLPALRRSGSTESVVEAPIDLLSAPAVEAADDAREATEDARKAAEDVAAATQRAQEASDEAEAATEDARTATEDAIAAKAGADAAAEAAREQAAGQVRPPRRRSRLPAMPMTPPHGRWQRSSVPSTRPRRRRASCPTSARTGWRRTRRQQLHRQQARDTDTVSGPGSRYADIRQQRRQRGGVPHR